MPNQRTLDDIQKLQNFAKNEGAKKFLKSLKLSKEDSDDDPFGDQQDDNQEMNIGALDEAELQEEKMNMFVNQYGVNIDIPAFYVQDAKVFPQQPSFCLMVVSYVIPDDKIYLRTHYEDQKGKNPELVELQEEPDFNDQRFKAASLKLMQKKEASFEEVGKEVNFDKGQKVVIEFSSDGKYLAILQKKINILDIWYLGEEDIDIIKQLENMQLYYCEDRNEDFVPPLITIEGDANFLKTKKLEFDQNDQYLLCWGSQAINTINLRTQAVKQEFKLDKDYFNAILDVQFVSYGENYYRCEVACRLKEHKIIIIFDTNGDQKKISQDQNYTKTIAYLHDDSKTMMVKISEDFSQVVLVNKTENYILEKEVVYDNENEEIEEYHQRVMGWLKGKCVRFIQKTQTQKVKDDENYMASLFYFICCKDYDRDLDIMTSDDENYKVSVKRSIEPDTITCFDVHIYYNVESEQHELICLSLRDEDFWHDTIYNKLEEVQKSYMFSKFRAVSSNWPFIAFQGIEYNEKHDEQDNYIWILNAYHPHLINRVQMPKNLVQICFTYMCENYDLYVIGEASVQLDESEITEETGDTKDTYELFHIDLNTYQDMEDKSEVTRLFQYVDIASINKIQKQIDDPDNQDNMHELGKKNTMIGFHVKAQQADDDDENAENKITALFLYDGDQENSIWMWQLGNEKTISGDKIEWICDTKSIKMTRLDDDRVIFRDDRQLFKEIETEKNVEMEEPDDYGNEFEKVIEKTRVKIEDKFLIRQINIEIDFNSYSIEDIYQENQMIGGTIKAYGYDYHRQILIIMKVPSSKKKGKQVKTCKIYDVKNSKLLWQSRIKDPSLIGRLKSSLYTLIDGHMYYNNDIIKVRYDLLEQKTNKEFEEDQIFDYYENIFNLETNEAFYTQMPICSLRFHRMVYVTKNRKELSYSKVLMIPFLHERKIYLNKQSEDQKYFYTTIRVPTDNTFKNHNTLFVTMCISQDKYYVYNQKGIQLSRVNYKDMIKQYGKLVAVSNNGQIFVHKKKIKEQNEVFKSWKLTISAMTLDKFVKIKTFILSDAITAYCDQLKRDSSDELDHERAIIIEDLYKQHITRHKDKYNISCQINNNLDIAVQIQQKRNYKGKSKKEKEQLKRRDTIEEKNQTAQQKANVIAEMMASKLRDQVDMIGNVFYFQKGSVGFEPSEDQKEEFELVLEEMGIDMDDFCEKDKKDKDKQQCFFTMNVDKHTGKIHLVDQESSVFSHFNNIGQKFAKGINGYSLSNDQLYFWNDSQIWYLKFNESEQDAVDHGESLLHFHDLKLVVSENEKDTIIKQVRTGSNSKIVAIIIRQSANSDCFMTWDVQQDRELESFDCGKDTGKIFWDAIGKAYITEFDKNVGFDKVYLMEQGLALTCYDVANINTQSKEEIKKTQVFGYHYGNRFDYEGHSWLYLRDYISISFSYMTFVIKRKIHDEDNDYQQDNYQFDIEQYNYIINRKTALTDDKYLVKDNTELLEFILKNFEQANPVLLEQIQYFHYEKVEKKQDELNDAIGDEQDPVMDPKLLRKKLYQSSIRDQKYKYVIQTPLHMAHSVRNNRSIKLLLQYMAKIDYNAMHHYRDILHDLVDVNGFTDYLWELPFQTLQMQNKQSLRVSDPYNDQIVRVNYSVTSYADDEYYKNPEFYGEQKENDDFKKYPVKISALRIHWINDIIEGQNSQNSDGKKFLDAILRSENIDLYGIPAISMIIEFLYRKYRSAVFYTNIPIYGMQLILYYITMYLNEHQFDLIEYQVMLPAEEEGGENIEKMYVKLVRRDHGKNTLMFIATLSMLVSMFILGFQVYMLWKLKLHYLNSDVAVDIVFGLLNTFITFCIYLFDFSDEAFTNTEANNGQHSIILRPLQMIGCLLLAYRVLFFLKIIDNVAPLVFIIWQVFIDIRYFVVVMFFIIAAFGNAFYLYGRNQVQYDEIEQEDYPLYASFSGQFKYMYLMCLGEISADDAHFSKGNASYFIQLWILFILAAFIIIVTMMNMLIAVMGNTFGDNVEVAENNTARQHLQFVIDHWYLNPMEDVKNKVNYLIVAFLEEEVEDNVEELQELQQELTDMRIQHQKDNNDIINYLKTIRQLQQA